VSELVLPTVTLTEQQINHLSGFLESADFLDDFIKMTEDDLITLHHSLGQQIRNDYLWHDYMEGVTEDHPDDISMAMIYELHRILGQKDAQ